MQEKPVRRQRESRIEIRTQSKRNRGAALTKRSSSAVTDSSVICRHVASMGPAHRRDTGRGVGIWVRC